MLRVLPVDEARLPTGQVCEVVEITAVRPGTHSPTPTPLDRPGKWLWSLKA